MGSNSPHGATSRARTIMSRLLIVGLVGVVAVIGLSAFVQQDTVLVSPAATVDDVYAALTTALGGATPDYDTQVKPVLDRNLTYQQLQDLVKSGGLADILAATAAPAQSIASGASAGPAINRPAGVTTAPGATVAPGVAHTVSMTAVMNVIRSQWDTQPQPVSPPRHSPLSSLACDPTGDVTVPATVTCTYVDPTIPDPTKPGTLSVVIDANYAVRWLGCSTDTGQRFYQLCVQAAPTAAPVVAPPAATVAPSYCGQEWITVSILDGRPHPVWIYIDGRGPLGPNIVNTYRVNVGAHTVYWIYNDGSRSQNDTVNVPACGYALIKLS